MQNQLTEFCRVLDKHLAQYETRQDKLDYLERTKQAFVKYKNELTESDKAKVDTLTELANEIRRGNR